MRISDVNQQNAQYFMSLLGLNSNKGFGAAQKTDGGSSAPEQRWGPYTFADLQRMAANDPTIKSVSIVNGKPHYEIDPSKGTNQYGVTGMFVTEDTVKEIVPISEDITNRLIENERNLWIENYGTSGSDFSVEEAIRREVLQATPEKDRINVAHSMSQIQIAEGHRIHQIIKDAIPGWKPGQMFDKEYIRGLVEGKSLDIKA
jgi:hypothetical protein